MNGLFNIDKTPGITSHDVVDEVRRITGIQRVGHTGTLDPQASGVLLVIVGKATRLSRFLTDQPKLYRTELTLGKTTDTQDIWGTVTAKNDNFRITRREITALFQDLVGTIEQVPPMYSAVKRRGKKLYELAREGKTVEREARRVEIFDIQPGDIPEVLSPESCSLTFEARVSSGTYIRTLCHDIGEELGPGGCMSGLRRLAVGQFSADNAHTLSVLDRLAEKDELESVLIDIGTTLKKLNFPRIIVKSDACKLAKNGAPLTSDRLDEYPQEIADGELVRVLAPDRSVIAVSRAQKKARLTFQPVTVFAGG